MVAVFANSRRIEPGGTLSGLIFEAHIKSSPLARSVRRSRLPSSAPSYYDGTMAPLSLISPVWQQKLSLPTPATGSEVSATARSLGKDYPIVFAQSVDFNGAELGPGYFVVEQISQLASERSNALSGGFEKGGII